MSTRTIVMTAEELRLIGIWANNARHDADQIRLMQPQDTPRERAALADVHFIEGIMAKLAYRESVPNSR